MVGTIITPAIDANQLVVINPSVLSAGGSANALLGLILTASTRLPVGSVLQFPNDGVSVANYFGATSQEEALASVYFGGFNGSTKKPATLYFYQYVWEQPVQAWLRGGSVSTLTLAQLQALSGNLGVTIDGVLQTASINLSAATSFSNGASIIGTALGIKGPAQGTYVGSISGTVLTVSAVNAGPQVASYTGSIGGTTLTVASMNSGTISVGDLVQGAGVSATTTITALGTGVGGAGTYTVNNSQTVASTTLTDYQASGALAVGDQVVAVGISAGTYIASLGTGAGGVGTYNVNNSQTYAGGTFTAYLAGVYYDAISGAYVIQSGTLGAASTMSYGSGALAVSLNLTQLTGAVLSQGAAQSTPAGAMNAIMAITKNFASFMTTFYPVATDKEAFAAWCSGQNNTFHYACGETSVVNTQAGGPSPSVAAIIAANYSGTSIIYDNPTVDTVGSQIPAFVMGYAASIDFDATQGRATAAYKAQAGVAAEVFSTSAYQYLIGYGLNCYGSFTATNEAFTFYGPGTVTGPFKWLDTYLNQIWLNNALQVALLNLLTSINSIPYNQAGYGIIASACKDPIIAAVNAGVIQPGVPLSNAQAAAVNAAAGKQIDGVLSTTGWYLQILPAAATTRAARTSPPINLWYTDGGAVQKIAISSVVVQ